MSKLEQIQTFIAIVDCGSLAAAGRRLHLSTPAISRKLTALELSVGAQLLIRSTRSIALTDTGKAYYQGCKSAVRELEAAEEAIVQSRREATGVLHVLCNRYFAMKYVLPKMGEFLAKHSKLRVHFDLAERFPDMEKEGIDIIFGMSLEGPPEMIRKRLSTTRYILCASKEYLSRFGIPEKPADLINHRYIAHSMRQPSNAIAFKGDKLVYLEPCLWLNDSFAMRDCALRHLGIVNLHDYVVNDAIHSGELIEILKPYQEDQKYIYLYYQQTRYLLPKIRYFIDYFSEIAYV